MLPDKTFEKKGDYLVPQKLKDTNYPELDKIRTSSPLARVDNVTR